MTQRCPLALGVGLAVLICSVNTRAQDIPGGRPLTGEIRPQDRTPAAPVAIPGSPFGVLHIELPLPANLDNSAPRVLVRDTQGRVFYPVVSVQTREVIVQPPPPVIGRRGGLIDRVRSAVRGEPEKKQVATAISVFALFRGEEPVEMVLTGDVNQRLRIETASADNLYQQLLTLWWAEYTQTAAAAIAGDDFPNLVHKYLTTMLANRLGLPYVDLDPPDPKKEDLSQPLKTLALLAAIEPMREDILEDVLTASGIPEQASLPIPPEPVWEPRAAAPIAGEVAIEELAGRVPPECFYLRFGAFTNYLWFQDIAERFGGDIAQAVMLRGFNYEASARMERMLAAKLTTIAKMFGDKLISDMGVIGSDLYMKEGASVGVIFVSTNPQVLTAAINADRKAVAGKHADATIAEVLIAGKPVSLLSTPDNRIRSFFVSDGPYVFVSSSRTLVRRFLEVGAGDVSLATTPGFRAARSWMPTTNDYAVFAYFSPEFFHRLVSPQYQIELRRRLSAIAHLEIAEVAQQVAASEGLKEFGLDSLQAAGLLPKHFDQRGDQARSLRTNDSGWIDSLRGARGSFLPIADVEIQSVTPREAAGYAQIASFYQNEWRHMDPLLLGLRRFQTENPDVEQVTVEAYIAPFEAEKYGWIARQLGQPTPIQLQLPADDAVSVQLHVRGGNTLGIVNDDYHLFGGVKDMMPPDREDTEGLIRTLQALKAAPAYIGGWPKPGIVEQLPLGLGLARPDAAGFSRLLGGLWRWQNGEFSLLSFDRSIIEHAIPVLQPTETNDLAQARARVADLSGSQLAAWINRKWYQRGWQSSRGNAQLLDAVHQQLNVPGPDCLAVAEHLFDVRFQCPLGGELQFQPLPQGEGGWWQSSAWSRTVLDARGRPSPPADYSAPWIDWFRGGQVHVTQGPDSLSLVGSLNLELQPLSIDVSSAVPNGLPSMNFDLFGLPGKLFGSGQPSAPPQPAKKSF